jgi:hypothetical protein
MQTKDITKDAAPRTSTSGEQAETKVPFEDKNVTPFPGSQDIRVPGMQIMPFAQSDMPGVPQKEPAYKNSCPHNIMHIPDREFFDSVTLQFRLEARVCLEYLKRYDNGISHEDAQVLCNAINVIDRAEVLA